MCLSPIYKKNEKFGEYGQSERYFVIPCGKCEECMKKTQNDWFVRSKAELERSSCALFITLTYDDLNVPLVEDIPVLQKSDLQDFFKRLRHHFPFRLKYLACGEYGGRTFRPHYHFVLFIPLDVILTTDFLDQVRVKIAKSWNLGNFMVDYATDFRIRYVVKYLLKGEHASEWFSLEKQEEFPPFRLVSKGLGNNILQRPIPDDVNKLRYSCDGGISFAYPRYYRDKIFKKKPSLKYQWIMKQREQSIDFSEYVQRIKDSQGFCFRNKSNKTEI